MLADLTAMLPLVCPLFISLFPLDCRYVSKHKSTRLIMTNVNIVILSGRLGLFFIRYRIPSTAIFPEMFVTNDITSNKIIIPSVFTISVLNSGRNERWKWKRYLGNWQFAEVGRSGLVYHRESAGSSHWPLYGYDFLFVLFLVLGSLETRQCPGGTEIHFCFPNAASEKMISSL